MVVCQSSSVMCSCNVITWYLTSTGIALVLVLCLLALSSKLPISKKVKLLLCFSADLIDFLPQNCYLFEVQPSARSTCTSMVSDGIRSLQPSPLKMGLWTA